MELISGPEATPSSLQVLVVEDDPTLGRLIEIALSRSCGRVTVVRTGADAVRLLGHEDFDAVACDVGLPDISGLRVIAAARDYAPAAGIVAITGLVDVEVAVDAMKAGADDFLAKPFDPQILWHMIQKAIDSRSQRLAAEQAQAYRRLAYTDALTDAPNRRFIDEHIDTALTEAIRDGTPLTVAYIDIDNFKLINDFVGYTEGDRLLRAIARSLAEIVPKPATFGRFGGDEFVIVFPGHTIAEAAAVIERLRCAVSRIELLNGSQVAIATRLSVGLAQYQGQSSPRELIAAAEDEMYLDKAAAPSADAGDSAAAILKVSSLKSLRNLVKAIDRRDSYTRYHSDHATMLAHRMAVSLGLSEDQRNAIAIGGPVHDLGKIVVPDEILRKPGPLTSEERAQMEEHSTIGAAITSAVTDYETVVDLVRHHHERFDGTGYPGGLSGAGISLPTRIFSLADAFSAMTTDRPYRKGLTTEQAIAEILGGRGTQFDPDLATIFVGMIERDAGRLRVA
ncbi:MAG: hypothetical protein Kow0010_18160 [Dehalococcoidia bacterium]